MQERHKTRMVFSGPRPGEELQHKGKRAQVLDREDFDGEIEILPQGRPALCDLLINDEIRIHLGITHR